MSVSDAGSLQTTFDFVLPRGYVDPDGVTHREGTMRLATARDELMPLLDGDDGWSPASAPCR